MQEKILKLENVSKTYKSGGGTINAITDINLSLNNGESLSIMGPSGSGKSTLLNIIGGLDRASKGVVTIAGKKIGNLNDKQLSNFRNKTIGFIFQFFNLQEYLNSVENIMLPMLIAGTNRKEAKEKAVYLLNQVGLKSKEKYHINQLSGGEMQRIAVARSLANDPLFLLADEPTANLDRNNANKILDLFEQINEKGVSVVVITHDPYVSKRFKKVVELSDGKIIRHYDNKPTNSK